MLSLGFVVNDWRRLERSVDVATIGKAVHTCRYAGNLIDVVAAILIAGVLQKVVADAVGVANGAAQLVRIVVDGGSPCLFLRDRP